MHREDMVKMNKLFLIAGASLLATTAVAATDDPVNKTIRDYRQSSGVVTATKETTESNNTSYNFIAAEGRFSKDSGTYFSRYLAVADADGNLLWDASKNAVYDVSDVSYFAVDTLFVLSGNAYFTNETAITFSSKNNETVGKLVAEGVETDPFENNVYLFDNAVFRNASTADISYVSNNDDQGTTTDHSLNFLLTGTSRFENSGNVNLSVGGKASVNFELNNSSSMINGGHLFVDGVEIYDNAVVQNFAGLASIGEATLYDSAKFTNFGDVYGAVTLSLDPDDDNDASLFYNHANLQGTVRFEIEADNPNDDFDADERSSATFVNRMAQTLYSSDLTTSVYVFNESQKNQLKKLNFRNRLNFKNYGSVQAWSTVNVGSLVTLTVASGSDFGGGYGSGSVSLGNAEEIYVNDTQTTTSEALSETSYLNVILGAGTDTTTALLGTATFNKKVDLTVSSESSSMKQKVKLYSSANNASGTTVSADDFVATTGTFTIGGKNYSWTLNTGTGEIEATLEGVTIVEKVISSESENLNASELSANTYVTFADSLSSFSGKIESTSGETTDCEIAVTKEIFELTGDLSAHSGLLSIAAGKQLTVNEGGKLGSGNIEISNQGTLSIRTSADLANDISGFGNLRIDGSKDSDVVVSLSGKISVEQVLVGLSTESSQQKEATLKGSVYLDGSALSLGARLALSANDGEQITLANDSTVLVCYDATLSLTRQTGTKSEDTTSDAAKNLIAKLNSGNRITIFSGSGTVEFVNSAEEFLGTDAVLKSISGEKAVIFRHSGSELSVGVASDISDIVDAPAPEGLDAGFVAALIGSTNIANINKLLAEKGFVDEAMLGTDPIVVASLRNDVAAVQKILRNASPIGYAAMTAVPVAGFYNDVDSVSARLKQRRTEYDIWSHGDPYIWEFFAQAQGSFVENDSALDAPAFDFDTYGVLAGADCRFSETFIAGLAVACEYGSADIHDNGGDIDIYDVRLTAFGEKTLGKYGFINGGAQIGFGGYDATRKSAYGESSGDTWGWNAGIFADAGIRLEILKSFSATPYIGFSYAHAGVGSFEESDGNALDIDSFSGDSLRARIGFSLDWETAIAETPLHIGLDFAYAHDFLGDEVDIDYSLDNQNFTATAAMMPEDVFSVSPTVSVDLTKSSSIYAAYTFAAGTDSSTAHRANLGFRYRF